MRRFAGSPVSSLPGVFQGPCWALQGKSKLYKEDKKVDHKRFLDLYPYYLRGRKLANLLNLRGRGSERLANSISNYCSNRRALEYCATEKGKKVYSDACASILEFDIYKSPAFNQLSPQLLEIFK